MANLYDLPKDMLVKLVATIREETIKECEEKSKKEKAEIIKDLIDDSGSFYVERCCIKYCEELVIVYNDNYDYKEEYKEDDYYYKNGNMYFCYACRDNYCENHKSLITSGPIVNRKYCEYCYYLFLKDKTDLNFK